MRAIAALVFFGTAAFPTSDGLRAQMRDPEIGVAAPSFTLPDTYGNEHSLSDYYGRWVVLEWLSYGCPFVQKHYESGNMGQLQEGFVRRGVAWLSVVSSLPGEQGDYGPAEMNTQNAEHGNRATAVLLDTVGAVGASYAAKTTPQLYVVDPQGVLVYNGAIDDMPTSRISDVAGARNYLAQALDEAMSGRPVSQPSTHPYGCTIRYR